MGDHAFGTRFFNELEELVENLQFQVTACVIKKQPHLDRYGLKAMANIP